MATWVHTCEECQRDDHDKCKSPTNNPCDCAKNDHK